MESGEPGIAGAAGGAPEPRWLDEQEAKTWVSLLAMMIRLPAALDAQLQRDAGLSNFEYQVLAGLSQAPGQTMRMSGLAAWSEGSLPRLSQVTGRLERRGLVRRHPDPADGRSTLATLTADGAGLLEKAAPGHVETVRRLVFDSTTKAQHGRLCDIARRIVRAIDPADRCLQD